MKVRLIAGREVECLVDTGFIGGALVLTQSVVDELGLPIIGYEDELEMVGGETMSADIALARIEWLGEIKSVDVLIKDDLLIGTQLLEGAQLVIDYATRTLAVTGA